MFAHVQIPVLLRHVDTYISIYGDVYDQGRDYPVDVENVELYDTYTGKALGKRTEALVWAEYADEIQQRFADEIFIGQ